MRSIVLGGTGMLGRQVVAEGRRRGHAVLGLSHAQADVTDSEALAGWVRAFHPWAVFNCAAMTGVDACETEEDRAFAVNAQGAGHAASAAASAGAHLLHVSTDYVFDGHGREPYREDHATDPLSAYGRSKRAGETEVLGYERATVVRTSWLFGPGGSNFVTTMLRLVAEGKETLRVVDDQVGCPTFTPYLARALWDLAEMGAERAEGRGEAYGVVHYRNREAISWCGFAREIVASWAPGVEVVPVTTEEFPRPAPRPAYSVLDVARFESLAGRPVESWRAGLGLYLDGLRRGKERVGEGAHLERAPSRRGRG